MRRSRFLFLVFALAGCCLLAVAQPSMAASFQADLVVTVSPQPYEFRLYVTDTMYRLEKVKGPMTLPPFPTIVNRETGLTWGLNPQARQYVEMREPEKTILMNPIAGWKVMKQGLRREPGENATVNEFACRTFLYHEGDPSRPAYTLWYAPDLRFFVRQAAHAANGDTVMELRNIRVGPQDAGLFEIPNGFTRMAMEGPGKAGPSTAPAPAQPSAPSPPAAPASESSPAGDLESGGLMIILDASGSMWGRIQGRPKIDIAKEVLTGLIGDLPDEGIRVGLVAYGHRRKGDCSDVEELLALGPLDKGAFVKCIQEIQPKGKTPITLSVRQTAERLKTEEDETTILLVSDGKETCEGDPCALVRELKQAGVRFVLHVIGFDVTEEERGQLACMAEAGGGEYFTAKTAGDLQLAAGKIMKQASQKPPVTLEVETHKDGRPVKGRVQVFFQGQEKLAAEAWSAPDRPARFRLPAGTYDIRAQDKDVIQQTVVEDAGVAVSENDVTRRVLTFPQTGLLEIRAVKEGDACKAYITVHRQADDKYMADGWTKEDGTPAAFKLLPGTYSVTVKDRSLREGPTVTLKGIEVLPAQTAQRTASFAQEGLLEVRAVKEGAPCKTYVLVHRQSDDKYMGDGWTKEDGTPAAFKLLPGTYSATVKDRSLREGPTVTLKGIEVLPAQTAQRTASFAQEGLLEVRAVKEGAPCKTYVLVHRQSDDKYMGDGWTKEDGSPAVFKLLPGTYSATVKDRSLREGPTVTLKGIEVLPAQTAQRTASFAQEGLLEVRAVKEGAPCKTYVLVHRQADDKYMGDGWTKEDGTPAAFKLLPDTYKAIVKDRSLRETPTVTLEGIEVRPAETAQRSASFVREGVLEVRAVKEGAPCKTYVLVHRQSDNKYMGDGWTREDGSPAVFKLLPGTYKVIAKDRKAKVEREVRDVVVESGRKQDVEAAF